MSQLYIRVMTGFFSHRKTNRLRRDLGNDALWIPPRLWAYAAENQPDGDFSRYSTEELAELLGCSKHSKILLQALKNSGFVDESGGIHDWHAHNRYHQTFSERAKKAALARWGRDREKSPTPPKEIDIGKGTGEQALLARATSIEKHQNNGHLQEIDTEEKAITVTMTAGIPEDFSRYVYQDWSARAGKDAGGVLVNFLPYVTKRWAREQIEWRAKTHKGTKTHETNSKPNPRNLGTGVDPAAQGRAIAEHLAKHSKNGVYQSPTNPLAKKVAPA